MEEELMTVFSRSFLFSGNFCSFEVHFLFFLQEAKCSRIGKRNKNALQKISDTNTVQQLYNS